jgi:hypothetical protein
MVLGTMMFGYVVTKVFDTWVPEDSNLLVRHLIYNPEVAHFHGSRALAFYGAVRNADRRGVVTVDRGRGLGMAHLVEDEAQDFGFLNIQEEGSEFCFCG